MATWKWLKNDQNRTEQINQNIDIKSTENIDIKSTESVHQFKQNTLQNNENRFYWQENTTESNITGYHENKTLP